MLILDKRDENQKAADDELANDAALSPADQLLRKASLDVVQANFLWMAHNVSPHIQQLHTDLLKEDAPGWSEVLLGTLVDVALAAGGAGFGQLLAVKYVDTLLEKAIKAKPSREGAHELAKSFIEQGMGKGIEGGRKALQGGGKQDVVERFVLSQHDAADQMYKANHDAFVHTGRSKIKTVAEAQALEQSSNEEFQKAPEIQYRAARDAWVTYLAQQKFGVNEKIDKNDKSGVTRTTDMTNQARRSKELESPNGRNHTYKTYGGKGENPEHAPNDFEASYYGKDEGVLFVAAKLPAITATINVPPEPSIIHMDGKPEVAKAYLNGVNGTIRDSYQGASLADVKIPRQIVAQVEGDTPSFTINLDETGDMFSAGEKTDWLGYRAAVEDPRKPYERSSANTAKGLHLLLQELVLGDIKKGG